MGLTLNTIVPWGRSYEEYVAMFGLTETDLSRRLLGCGDGPAGFNAELTRRGGRIVSIDPLYAFDTAQIRQRIAETHDTVMAQMREHQASYVWTTIPSIEALGRVRLSAMDLFLADYEAGTREGRYLTGALPSLPVGNDTFDLALSSHFLFLYSALLSTDFHLQAITNMLRAAQEVRVFPLLTLDGQPSPHLGAVTEQLTRQGFHVDLQPVPYEFQRGGNTMMRIARQHNASSGREDSYSSLSLPSRAEGMP
ncbi:MAG: SAM-dependent methyltransferase [Nitrospira sp.]|nr:SAM-dependent methyltransferase [Nitrospira sp.]